MQIDKLKISMQKEILQIQQKYYDQIEDYNRNNNRFVYLNIDRPDEPLKSADSTDQSPRKIYTIIESIPEMKESRDLDKTN